MDGPLLRFVAASPLTGAALTSSALANSPAPLAVDQFIVEDIDAKEKNLFAPKSDLGIPESVRIQERKYKKSILNAVRKDGLALKDGNDLLRADKKVVLAAVRQNGWAIEYADESLKNDRDVILAAVSQDGLALKFLNKSLWNDKEIVLAAVTQNGLLLQCAGELLKSDREVVFAAVSNKWRALLSADESFRNDKEIAIIAVSQSKEALEHIDASLLKDKDVMLAAIKNNWRAIESADKSLKMDLDVVLAALSIDWRALSYVDESLLCDKFIILYFMMQTRMASQPMGGAIETLDAWRNNVIELFAPYLGLKEGVLAFSDICGDSSNHITRIRDLAIEITTIIDGTHRGEFRGQIHNHPSVANLKLIREYRLRAESGFPKAIPFLDEIGRLAEALYNPQFDLKIAQASLSLPLRKSIRWPATTTPGLKELGDMAVSIRDAFDSNEADLNPYDRFELMTLAIQADKLARGLAAPSESDDVFATANKMATLVRVLFGSGYGEKNYLAVAMDLDRIADSEAKEDVLRAELRRNAILVASMLKDYERAQQDLLKPLARSMERRGLITAETRATFASSFYRATGVFLLGEYISRLGLSSVNTDVASKVLPLLQMEPLAQTSYSTHFFGDEGFPQNPLQVGGKAAGLDLLMRKYPENTPMGFVLPPRSADYGLSVTDRAEIAAAVKELERRTGRELGKDLAVSVRSGAAISMPGAMSTKLNVDSLEDIFHYVESVYASWNSEAAREFRCQNGIPDAWGTAVNIVEMIDGTHDEMSGAGIASNGHAVFGQSVAGDLLVSGQHNGQDALPSGIQEQLTMMISELESQTRYPVEVEFTVESGKLFLLQLRRAHLSREDEIRWYVKQVFQKAITREEAIIALGGRQRLDEDKITTIISDSDHIPAVATGWGENRPVSGELAFNADDVAAIMQRGAQAIFVTDNPDAGESAALAMRAGAVIVTGGNPLAHLFDIARDQKIPFLVTNYRIVGNNTERSIIFPNGQQLSRFATITLDPKSGKMYVGNLNIVAGASTVEADIDELLSGGELVAGCSFEEHIVVV